MGLLTRQGRLLGMLISLDELRRFAVANSLFPPTTLKYAPGKLGFIQADLIRPVARSGSDAGSSRQGLGLVKPHSTAMPIVIPELDGKNRDSQRSVPTSQCSRRHDGSQQRRGQSVNRGADSMREISHSKVSSSKR